MQDGKKLSELSAVIGQLWSLPFFQLNRCDGTKTKGVYLRRGKSPRQYALPKGGMVFRVIDETRFIVKRVKDNHLTSIKAKGRSRFGFSLSLIFPVCLIYFNYVDGNLPSRFAIENR